ncbi:hypothetical protein FDK38_002741 [Candidozyma auris]|nr:hypothetical protein FDK38_002741 [[Candida] auris]
MAVDDTEGYWDIVISSLQDICNANESLSFDNIFADHTDTSLKKLGENDLETLKEEINDHMLNIGTATRLISTAQQNLQTLITNLENAQSKQEVTTRSSKSSVTRDGKRASSRKGNKKYGRQFWVSKYDPSEPIIIGSEVAFKLKNRHFEEWIQCEVTKILGDGTRYEIRDPEPDENNNPGQTFKANYKDILLIPSVSEVPNLISYPHGTKVLARYPETTTFYPAVVEGQKKDGTVKLKFDGEEEVNKVTEVERRLVLPFPQR